MSSQGPNGPGTIVATNVATSNWQNPNNIFAVDGVYATDTWSGGDGNIGDILTCTNFGFFVPNTATINGISVIIVRHADNTGLGATDYVVELIKGGVVQTTENKADTSTVYGTSDATITYGSSADTWGLTIFPSDINASNFGIQYQPQETSPNNGPKIYVDAIQIIVYYTGGTGGNTYNETPTGVGLNAGGSAVVFEIYFKFWGTNGSLIKGGGSAVVFEIYFKFWGTNGSLIKGGGSALIIQEIDVTGVGLIGGGSVFQGFSETTTGVGVLGGGSGDSVRFYAPLIGGGLLIGGQETDNSIETGLDSGGALANGQALCGVTNSRTTTGVGALAGGSDFDYHAIYGLTSGVGAIGGGQEVDHIIAMQIGKGGAIGGGQAICGVVNSRITTGVGIKGGGVAPFGLLLNGVASFSDTSSLTMVAANIVNGNAYLTGNSSLSATGTTSQTIFTGSCFLSETSSINSIGTGTRLVTCTLSGQAKITARGIALTSLPNPCFKCKRSFPVKFKQCNSMLLVSSEVNRFPGRNPVTTSAYVAAITVCDSNLGNGE